MSQLFELGDSAHVPTRRLVFPTDEIAEERIQAALAAATPLEYERGQVWYNEAHELCRTWLGRYAVLSLAHVAGIVAALSPMQSWSRNTQMAKQLLATGTCQGLGYAVEDARRIYDGAHPYTVLYDNGRNNTKVRSFFENIYDPDNSEFVTIDRHMIGLLADDAEVMNYQRWILPRHHAWATERFQRVAVERDLLPNQAQAISWLVWRRRQGIRDTSPSGQLSLFEYTAA